MIKAYDKSGQEHRIDVIKEKEHYMIEIDGRFYCSCDDQKEVDEEIPAIMDLHEFSFIGG